jgi:hypothetical protein
MLNLVGRQFWVMTAVLALVISATRLGHFGELSGPPDASWAVFLLGGLWLRTWKMFPAFFVLGWLIDLAAFALGTPSDCYSPAYLLLIPAYGSLWLAGRWLAASFSVPRAVLAGLAGGVACFAFANLGMFWFAPSVAAPTAWAFAQAVAGYLPGYLTTLGIYAALALTSATLWSARTAALTKAG